MENSTLTTLLFTHANKQRSELLWSHSWIWYISLLPFHQSMIQIIWSFYSKCECKWCISTKNLLTHIFYVYRSKVKSKSELILQKHKFYLSNYKCWEENVQYFPKSTNWPKWKHNIIFKLYRSWMMYLVTSVSRRLWWNWRLWDKLLWHWGVIYLQVKHLIYTRFILLLVTD